MSTLVPPGRSLADRRPDLVLEWHPSRNGGVTPDQVFAGSDAQIWWLCAECGHEWNTKLSKRVSRGQGCRQCSAKRRAKAQATPSPGHSLADRDPELAAEWHPTLNPGRSPSAVWLTSGAEVWWLCPNCRHEWKASVYRRSTGVGCRKCAAARRGVLRATPTPGKSFADVYPKPAAEWHPSLNELKPTEVRPASRKKVWWRCAEGHEWTVAPADRQRGERCPDCAKRLIPIAKSTPKPGKSMQDVHPDIAAEWHPTLNTPVLPSQINPGSRTPRWWQCTVCGHVWKTTPDKRTCRGDGCRECSPIGVSARQIRLEYELAAAGLPVVHNHPPIPVAGRRPVRADIVAPALHLVVEYDGVRFHANLTRRDRAQPAALSAAGWSVLRVREKPLGPLGGNEIFVSPVEPIKAVALKTLAKLEKNGYIAENLADYLADPDVWAEAEAKRAIHKHRVVSLSSENPMLAAEFDSEKNGGVRADQIHPRSHTKFLWTCTECAHEWSSSVALRAAGHGCPKCGYKKVSQKLSQPHPGESFADRFPREAAHWHPNRNTPLTPDQVRPASNKEVWWRCEDGHEWKARVAYRRKYGCPDCRACSSARLLPESHLPGTPHG